MSEPGAYRLPTLAMPCTLGQTDSVLAILARPTALIRLVHRKIKQLAVTPKPTHLGGQLGDDPGQGNVGAFGASLQGTAAGQSLPFIVLGRFAFAAAFSF